MLVILVDTIVVAPGFTVEACDSLTQAFVGIKLCASVELVRVGLEVFFAVFKLCANASTGGNDHQGPEQIHRPSGFSNVAVLCGHHHSEFVHVATRVQSDTLS